MAISADSSPPLPSPVRVVLALAVVAVTLLGLWVTGGLITDDFRASMALTALWFGGAGAGAFVVSRRRRDLLLPVGGAFLATVAVVGGFLAWTSFRDVTVNERVVAAGGGNVVVADGAFTGAAHPTSGRAGVIEAEGGGRTLTLTDFETDPGPDLYVYIVPGRNAGSVDGGTRIARLKGNRGDQQYDLPRGLAVEGSTVVIWCRAFSVAFGTASL
jgi:hypothetical protein